MKFEEFLKSIESSTGIIRDCERNEEMDVLYPTFIAIADSMLKWEGAKYDDTYTADVIRRLLNWLYCRDCGEWSLTKGVLLKGGTGRGKTFLLKVFANLMNCVLFNYKSNGNVFNLRLSAVHARKLSSEFQNNGDEGIRKYIEKPCLMIDDIGTEAEESAHYGNRLNVIELVLSEREARNLLTFGTTNLNSFKDVYDDRMESRMVKLFNVYAFNHDIDYRKIKKNGK